MKRVKLPSAVVLLSGGQDSTTCLYWALERFERVLAIGFDYGQKHKQELEQAKVIAKMAGVPYRIFDVRGIFQNSSLVDDKQNVNEAHTINPDLPSSFTAGRNMVFLAVAAGYAYNERVGDIVTGVCQTDFSGYPDCRRGFIDTMERAVTLAVDSNIYIHTPLMELTKAETWKLAKDLGIVDIIRERTLTDYNGDTTMNEWGMGVNNNPATALRVKGYYEAKEKGWL